MATTSKEVAIVDIVDLPERQEIPRDGRGNPLVVPKGGGKPRALTRTTTFIDCIEDKTGVSNWRARSVLVGAARDQALVERAKGLDVKEDKAALMDLVEEALETSGANEKREKGTYLHALSELKDAGEPLPASATEADIRDMEAYTSVMHPFEIVEMEQFIACDELGVGGTFDRLLRYSGPGPNPDFPFHNAMLIGDLKTGTIEYGTSKIAAQLAIYSRGERYDFTKFSLPELTSRMKRGTPEEDFKKRIAMFKKQEFSPEEAAAAYSPLGDVNQFWGVVIHVPSGTGEASLHWADLNIGWEMAKLAKTIREARAERKGLRPFTTAAKAGVISVRGTG